MTDGNDVLYFERTKEELKDNDVFLTINRGFENDRGMFIVCDKKYQRTWKSLVSHDWEKIRNESCPIGIFESIEEVRAFALGLCLGQNKKWKD